MSKTFEEVLTGIREIGATKLTELDALCEEHKQWLTSAVAQARKQIAQLAPAAKKQKLGHDAVKTVPVEEEVSAGRAAGGPTAFRCAPSHSQPHPLQQPEGAPSRRSRRGRGGKAMETVVEEEAEEEAASPTPAAPSAEEAQPARKPRGVKPKRGKQQQQEAQMEQPDEAPQAAAAGAPPATARRPAP
jgi:hypothetical protein